MTEMVFGDHVFCVLHYSLPQDFVQRGLTSCKIRAERVWPMKSLRVDNLWRGMVDE